MPRHVRRCQRDLAGVGSSLNQVKAKLANSGFRLAVVIATLAGWLVLSNHCALAGLGAKAPAKKEHRCCQQVEPSGDNTPAPGKPIQCCKSLRVLVPDGTKAPVNDAPLLAVIPLTWEIDVHLAELRPSDGSQATGPPPDSPSFAELVLHRSMQAHAPPSV